jgi:general stress protein YciG
MSESETSVKPKKAHGFAAMDHRRRSEISKMGGKAAHAQGVAHTFSTEEAIRAGRLGGRAVQAKKREVRGIGVAAIETNAMDVVKE